MYRFISESEIKQYEGDILSFYDGSTLVKTIANPTNEQLVFFGYKDLVEDPMPEEREGYFIQGYYEDGIDITKKYRYIELIDPNI